MPPRRAATRPATAITSTAGGAAAGSGPFGHHHPLWIASAVSVTTCWLVLIIYCRSERTRLSRQGHAKASKAARMAKMDNIPDAGALPSAVKVNWRQVGPGVETSVDEPRPAAAPAAQVKQPFKSIRSSRSPTYDSCRPPGRHQTRAATMANPRRRSA